MIEMKHSGIDWISEIPAHWEVKRLKELGSFNKGLTFTKADLVDEGNPVISYGQIHSKQNTFVKLHDFLIRFVPDSIIIGGENSIVSKGDFIFADTSEDIDGCGNATYIDKNVKLYGGYHTVIFKTDSEENKYLAYLFASTNWRQQLRSRVKGIKVYSITQSLLNQTSVIIPPIEEQQAIANYLDKKTAEIDKQVELLDQKQKAYQKLKASLINQVVTRGLNPNAPLRDSEIDWIGEIPAHWEVKRLKDVSSLYSGLTGKAGDDFTPEFEEGTKPYIPFTNVLNNNEVSPKKLNYVHISEGEEQNRVQKNDLIFLMSSEDYESIAKSAVVTQDLGEVYLNSFCRGLHIQDNNIYSKFLNYLLSANVCRDALRFEARGFTRINIKIDKIASHFIFFPPLEEQKAIADYLDKKTAEIDDAITNIDKKIKAYKRLKQSLIDEVVTGKRKI